MHLGTQVGTSPRKHPFKKVWPAIKIFFELFHIDAVVDTFCMGLGAEGAPLLAAMRAYRYSKSKEEAL